MDGEYKIKLSVFEGPMDILLALIRENKINIYDIPISFITNQYLEYLKIMKELNLDIAGEFLVMAATLIYIKSRMLLPSGEAAQDEEEEDPRVELVQKLLEYQFYKETALVLKEKEDEWEGFLSRPELAFEGEVQQEKDEVVDLGLSGVSLYDLLSAFCKVLENAPADIVTITKETLTVRDKIVIIMEQLNVRGEMDFKAFFEVKPARIEVVTTFLAMLELLKLGVITVYQQEDFANIIISLKMVDKDETV